MEFTFVFQGMKLTSPDRYIVDQYGNRFMVFEDIRGNKFQISRDELVIDMATGNCTKKNNEVNVKRI